MFTIKTYTVDAHATASFNFANTSFVGSFFLFFAMPTLVCQCVLFVLCFNILSVMGVHSPCTTNVYKLPVTMMYVVVNIMYPLIELSKEKKRNTQTNPLNDNILQCFASLALSLNGQII